MIKATTAAEAWEVAYKIADAGEYELDKDSEARAGYPIYRAKESYYSRICDLTDRLEVVKADGTSINVWIEPEDVTTKEEPTATQDATTEEATHYGDELAAKIRESTKDFSKISDFDKFVLDYGYKYKTLEELQAGYDRIWKTSHGILITLEEFLTEAGKKPSDPAVDTYEVLVGLVEEKKLRPGEVFGYAHYHWCLNKPEAIVAYQTDPNKWAVNNCDTEITEERARVEVCEEWGFEASRVRIIGTPYYDATDWQFIRFDCAHMTWLWKDGNLYQVYV